MELRVVAPQSITFTFRPKPRRRGSRIQGHTGAALSFPTKEAVRWLCAVSHDCTVHDFQKNGITADEKGTVAIIRRKQVRGVTVRTWLRQNDRWTCEHRFERGDTRKDAGECATAAVRNPCICWSFASPRSRDGHALQVEE
jgi:hypothetical protein